MFLRMGCIFTPIQESGDAPCSAGSCQVLYRTARQHLPFASLQVNVIIEHLHSISVVPGMAEPLAQGVLSISDWCRFVFAFLGQEKLKMQFPALLHFYTDNTILFPQHTCTVFFFF